MTVVGIVLLFCAALTVSISLTRESRSRLDSLEAVIGLIGFIKQNIDTFSAPVDIISSSWSCSVKGMEWLTDAVRDEGIRTVLCGEFLDLSKEAREEIEAFAKNIGMGYRDEEIKRCEYYLSRFEGYLADEKESFARCRPLYRYVPFVCAASIIIIAL